MINTDLINRYLSSAYLGQTGAGGWGQEINNTRTVSVFIELITVLN